MIAGITREADPRLRWDGKCSELRVTNTLGKY